MNKTTQFIDYSALKEAPVHQDPYPYTIIPNFIKPQYQSPHSQTFPDMTHRGSIPTSAVQTDPLFQDMLNELHGPELRKIIAEKFAIDLEDKPIMTTLRGFTSTRDGKIHTDSKDKLITVLLYLNETWDSPEGHLRLLRSKHSLEDYAAEVPPTAGTCLIFKVTPNGWHGHTTFIGKRLSIQLNYVKHESALTKHLGNHRFSAMLKHYLPWLFKRSFK